MMTRHWKNTERPIPGILYAAALQRSWRDGCRPAVGDDHGSGAQMASSVVEIEDARLASSVTEMLMGTEVPPRRQFIYENAVDAELDV